MNHRFLRGLLYLTIFTSSMGIMFLQLVAGRIIAQFLGQSLLTWTSIIATTLAGIAVGNRIGGWLADRRDNLKTIPILFIISPLLIGTTLWVNSFLGNLELLKNLPWSIRILLHVVTLFLPSFIALGTISPVLSKMLLKLTLTPGTSIGIFFSFSLLGSLVGTFFTGYYLLALCSYTTLIILSCIVLISLSFVYILLLWLSSINAVNIDIKSINSAENPEVISRLDNEDPTLLPFPTLLILSFWSGMGVMIVEIVAARLLARNYGNSLYTWTTNIGIILAGMSIGGYLGGYLSQRFRPSQVMVIVLFLSSLFTLIIPLMNILLPWQPFMWNFSWPNQILIHTILVFGPCSVVFGMISPLLVRMISLQTSGEHLGRKIGFIYSTNAIGSIAGTLLAGFYTIAYWGSSLTLTVVACVSAILILFIRPASGWVITYICLMIMVFLSTIIPTPPWNSLAIQLALVTYKTPQIIYEKESHYNYILVRAPDPDRPHIRDLVLDKMIHNQIDLKNPYYLWGKYERLFYSALRVSQRDKEPNRLFIIGGGGYTFCHFLEKEFPNAVIEVAEIDPEVTKTAFEYFGLPKDTSIIIHHKDGRNCIEELYQQKISGKLNNSYDCILNDSFSDYTVPFHLTTQEFVQKIYHLLSEDGIYLCNIIECLGNAQFLASMYKTVESVFPYVYLFNTTDDPLMRDTFVMVGSKVPIPGEEIERLAETKYNEQYFFLTKAQVEELVKNKKSFVLTDSFAPVENLLAPMVSTTEETPYLRRMEKAKLKLKKGLEAEVVQDMMEVIQQRPYMIEPYVLLAESLILTERYPEAIAWAKKAIDKFPSNTAVYIPLAVAYTRIGDYIKAIETYEKIIELNPSDIENKITLSSLYIRQNKLDRAEQLLQELKAQQEASNHLVEIHKNLATIAFIRKDYPSALQNLLLAEQIQPNDYSIKHELAIVYQQLGDEKNAQQKIDECRKAGYPVSLDIQPDEN